MLVPGDLGFPSLVVVGLLILGFVIHQKWRNAVAKEEEITRLVVIASEETAMAELEAAVEYSSIPVARRYECAVCYRPTTTRCSQCKAVRYCSGKCQIIHWRQGHKDDCRPPITTMQFDEGSDFGGKAASQKQFEMYVNDYETKPSFSSDAPSAMDDEVKSRADVNNAKGAHTGSASSSTSSLAVFIPSTARSESSVDVSVSEVLGSNTPDRSEGPLYDDIAPDMLGTTASVNDTELTTLRPSECTDLVNSVNCISCASKLNKMKSSYRDEVVHLRSQFPKAKTVISDDVQPSSLGNKKLTDGTAFSEKLVMDAAKLRSSPFLSCSRSDSVANDRRNDSRLSKCQEVRSFSSSASVDHLSSTTKEHSVPSLKAAKIDSVHALPAKIGSIPSLPQYACNGLKTSVRKVVEQFKTPKQSKPYLLGVGSENAGKYHYKILFPYELFMKLYSWDKVELSPFGLLNCGNSCYANAVLQCLAFTRPLTSYLLQGLHSKACQKKGWCFICEFECLILKAREGYSPLSPIGILSQIQKIGSHLGPGKEEDAHEFLRYAVDTMQSVCLKEARVVGPLAEETTLVGLTFGGYLQSKIKCMNCLGRSEQCEQMMDLTVEIGGDIGTLEEALAQFTATEILDGENKYQCRRCNSYEKAKKKLTVLEAPNVLTIVLKRFQSGNFGKLNKSIRFPEVLNMAPYMSGTSDKSPLYSLYAVVVHLDIMNAAFSGHYVCYVKNFQGEWFKIDDSTVIPVELERVLLEGAYMLLYARHSPRAPALVRNTLSHDGKFKIRNLEAVPSSHTGKKTTSKERSNSMFTSTDASIAQRRLGKYPYWMTQDGTNQLFDPEDWIFHSMQRIPMMDSSSESSSLFSCSDEGSCSTESTKDSASTEDFSDYIFGEVGPSCYSPYRLSSGLDASSSPLYSRPSPLADSGSLETCEYNGEGERNTPFLYTDTTKQCRKLNTHSDSSRSRETDFEHLVWANPFDKNYGVPVRRVNRERSAQTFF